MKKIKFFFIIVLLIGFTNPFHGLYAKPGDTTKDVKTVIIPQKLSPEETLKVYLNAFISRDINTVMAYLPNGTGEKISAWRERVKMIYQAYMVEKRHIKAVESIKLIKIETQKTAKLAIMEAILVTSPKFSGAVICDGNGKCTVTLQWAFRQETSDAPWLFDGGGF
ncbi:MAG: hypothetical protein ACM3SY_05595 [Candidatus Omnitrophota bacterium]